MYFLFKDIHIDVIIKHIIMICMLKLMCYIFIVSISEKKPKDLKRILTYFKDEFPKYLQ